MSNSDGPDVRLWIVLPAFEEARMIGTVLASLSAWLPRVVVVDDGSQDNTGDVARKAGAHVVRHAVNLGAGAALQTGIDFALERGATHICSFDADGQHDAKTIDQMVAALEDSGAEVVLASRFLGDAVGMPPLRRLTLWAALRYTRWQTRRNFSDTHNGLRLLTARAAMECRLTQPGMAHCSEILNAIAKHNLRFVEVPTIVTYSQYSLGKGQRSSNSIKILFDLLYASWSGQH
jgi:glycosyltransferase involved in cell wall biosynthesis